MAHQHDCPQCGGYWVCEDDAEDNCDEQMYAQCRDCLIVENADLESRAYSYLRALILCVYDYQQDSTLYVFGKKPDAESARCEVAEWLRKAGAL